MQGRPEKGRLDRQNGKSVAIWTIASATQNIEQPQMNHPKLTLKKVADAMKALDQRIKRDHPHLLDASERNTLEAWGKAEAERAKGNESSAIALMDAAHTKTLAMVEAADRAADARALKAYKGLVEAANPNSADPEAITALKEEIDGIAAHIGYRPNIVVSVPELGRTTKEMRVTIAAIGAIIKRDHPDLMPEAKRIYEKAKGERAALIACAADLRSLLDNAKSGNTPAPEAVSSRDSTASRIPGNHVETVSISRDSLRSNASNTKTQNSTISVKPVAHSLTQNSTISVNLTEMRIPVLTPSGCHKSPENLASDHAAPAPEHAALVGKPISRPTIPPEKHHTDADQASVNVSSKPPKKKKTARRAHHHITAREAASVYSKLELATSLGITFSVALVVNYEATPAYDANHRSTESQRRLAQQKASRWISDALTNFSKRCRAGSFAMERISVMEQPAVGVGAHENILVNLPATTEHVRELAAFMTAQFGETPFSMTEHRRKAGEAKRKGRTYKGAPFSIRAGDNDLILNPDAGFMTAHDVLNFAAYPLKSLPDDTIITIGDRTTTAAQHRQMGHMLAHEPSGHLLQSQIVRSSRNLSNAAVKAAGIIPDPSLAWLVSRKPKMSAASKPTAPKSYRPSSKPTMLEMAIKLTEEGMDFDEALSLASKKSIAERESLRKKSHQTSSKNRVKPYEMI